MTEFEKYFKSLQSQKISDITEHSHRSALKTLVESFVGAKVKVLHEPKREGKFGSPDFKITHTESIIGYIENKKIEDNLDKAIKSDQLKKYQALSDNILLTNYIDWVWIKGGKIQKRETLCYLTDIENKKAKLDNVKVAAVEKLIKGFLSQAPKEIADAKKLAEELAIRAKLLKDFLLDELKRQQEENTDGRLFQLYETFRSFVFHELTISEFADAFAQNLVYGMFLAKLNAETQTVNLYNAKKFIPASFELIKELVNFLDELDNEEYRETRWIVEEVLTIMNNLNLHAIQDSLSFTKRRKDANNFTIKDPYVYFYENFLAAYDKKLREAKGVYYTPPPVVNFIVRAVDDILISTFKIKEGLADKNKVTVLDFATGTGTFLVEMLQQIFEKLPKDSGKKDLIIKEHVLKNIFGFEYLIAPYTIAHLKLSQFLKDNGYELKAKERLQVYLTNTLEPIPAQIKIPLLPALTEETKQAQEVKDKPILVITGNPPYSINSKNNGEWIKNKIEDYKIVDGQKLKERNPKALQDDYVKFIRFAQDKMDKVEEGVVGIITNHTFLFNPTFPGMRQSLMNTFSQMYFINLHGNAKMKEKTPEGDKDENVFDIEQGVAISILVKKKGLSQKIFYSDFWGSRQSKYQNSLEETIKSIEWKELTPNSPTYLFQPINETLKEKYNEHWSLLKIFNLSSSGIKTHRDHFAYAFDKLEMEKRISDFKNQSISDDKISEKYSIKDTRDWQLKLNRVRNIKLEKSDQYFQECNYRPFDKRSIFFHETIVELPRKEIMLNVQESNVALISGRAGQVVGGDEWNLSFVTDKIADVNLFYRGGAVLFPLYILRNGIEAMFFEGNKNEVREPQVYYGKEGKEFFKKENFLKDFRDYIDALYKQHFSPEEIFGYIYSILHSPTYRSKYAEFLKIDFPKIPFTADKKVFKQLAELGNELIEAHLLKKTDLDYPFGEFIGKGDSIVEKGNYVVEKKTGKLYINKTQYFNNVPQQVYDFYIGGYQVLDKYMKDRKGRKLGWDESTHVENVIRVIAFTIDQMKKIDSLTKRWI
ncbi:MAG: type ISP restriction/modification enzyme [Ignavibacteria bacterium]|nr:type ISP restriction/modification enzyme [Ignavibacteria bacterium]